jgi:hypothetical protein
MKNITLRNGDATGAGFGLSSLVVPVVEFLFSY